MDGYQLESATLQAEADRPVLVARYDRPHEGHLARLSLEVEGIEAVLEGEYAAGLAWAGSGTVRLFVRAWQEEAARRVLEAEAHQPSSADWLTDDLEADRCPRCGSLRVVEPLGKARRWRWFGLALPFGRNDARCRNCAHRWAAP